MADRRLAHGTTIAGKLLRLFATWCSAKVILMPAAVMAQWMKFVRDGLIPSATTTWS